MTSKSRLGVAKILMSAEIADNKAAGHAGMGIVLDAHHILTCAHVVNAALRREFESKNVPDEKISAVFPLSRSKATVTGKTVVWHPRGAEPVGDVAIIRFEEDIPSEVGLARFRLESSVRSGQPLGVYGFKSGEDIGNHVDAKFKGDVGNGNVQFNGEGFETVFVSNGYSGAAVWDEFDKAVVGMAVGKYEAPQRVGYMIPTSALIKVCPQIAIQPPPAKPSSIVPIEPDRGTQPLTSDAISKFGRYCGAEVKNRLPRSNVRFLPHAWAPSNIDERFFYIADVSGILNVRADWEDNDFPLSYELFFQKRRLGTGVAFEVSLVWAAEYDKELFGEYWADARMQRYQVTIDEQIQRILPVDFVRIGAEWNLEVGYWRMLLPEPAGGGLRDLALRSGATGAVEDIVNLKTHCEDFISETILSVASPVWAVGS